MPDQTLIVFTSPSRFLKMVSDEVFLEKKEMRIKRDVVVYAFFVRNVLLRFRIRVVILERTKYTLV